MSPRSAPDLQTAYERLVARAHRRGRCLLVGRINRHQAIRVAGQRIGVHRVAWMAKHGPIPDGMPWVLHDPTDCRYRNCIKVRHLRPGTAWLNVAHMEVAGTIRRGQRHPRAKLSNRIVRAARRAHERGEPTGRIARRLGYHRVTIGHAIWGRTWRHIR